MLTQFKLKNIVSYDSDSGVFIRLSNGMPFGNMQTGGYLRGRINGRVYLCHRLVFLYVFGYMPKKGVDHINGIKDDNRLNNLREANQSQNGQNIKIFKENKHGLPGVTWDEKRKKWTSKIKTNGKVLHIGSFPTAELASQAYIEKKKEIHAFFVGV